MSPQKPDSQYKTNVRCNELQRLHDAGLLSALFATLTLFLSACLAEPAPAPTPTATSSPPTATAVPTATLPPAVTPTQFAPPIDLSAIRSFRMAAAPVTFDPEQRALSGLIPVQALALDDLGRDLFVISGAQQSPGNLQLYRLNLDTGAFTSGTVLSGMDRFDRMLVLPASEDQAGVLLSACAASCGIWRVQLLSSDVVQLAASDAAPRGLHFVRNPFGQQQGLSFLEPASETGTTVQLIQHNFLEEPLPSSFESTSSMFIPLEDAAPADLESIVIEETQRTFLLGEDGLVLYSEMTEDDVILRRLIDQPENSTALHFLEAPLELFPSVEDRIIIRFDLLEDLCGTYQQAMGEEVLIAAADGEVALTRVALSRNSVGLFDTRTGVFQTLKLPEEEISESYSGRINLDGSVSGLYKIERNECLATYAISGRLDPPPPVVSPPVLAWFTPAEGAPALSLRRAGSEEYTPLFEFPDVQPTIWAYSAFSEEGTLTFAFNYESGVQVFRVTAE